VAHILLFMYAPRKSTGGSELWRIHEERCMRHPCIQTKKSQTLRMTAGWFFHTFLRQVTAVIVLLAWRVTHLVNRLFPYAAGQSYENANTPAHAAINPWLAVQELAGCGLAQSGMYTHAQRMAVAATLVGLLNDSLLSQQQRSWVVEALQNTSSQIYGTDFAAWQRWYASTR